MKRLRALVLLIAAAGPLVHAQPVELADPTDTEGLIPIRFHLDAPSFVTVAIDEAGGRRVRNLVSETPLPAGDQVVWWDGFTGTDYLLRREPNLPGRLVEPGTYTVRTLVRDDVALRYEFTVYNPGTPPWSFSEKGVQVGRWLSDHSAPSGIVYLPDGSPYGKQPQLLISSGSAEWGDVLVWVDAATGGKIAGRGSIGGTFGGAMWVAHDTGPDAVAGVHIYAVTIANGAMRLLQFLNDKKERGTIDGGAFKITPSNHGELRGLAVRNGIVVVSRFAAGRLIVVDAHARAVVGEAPVESPAGVAYSPDGSMLYVASGDRIVRYRLPADWPAGARLPEPEVFVPHIEHPNQLAFDRGGRLYVSRSTWGDHDPSGVSVFDREGRQLREIGAPGAPEPGRYEPTRMGRASALAVTPQDVLWVVENISDPRRVSTWSTEGELRQAFYGPPNYGGGGILGPDRRTFFYDHGLSWADSLEFSLDFEAGTWAPSALTYRRPPKGARFPGAPIYPLEVEGRRYFTGGYNTAVNGDSRTLTIFLQGDDRVSHPVAVVGSASSFAQFNDDRWEGHLPKGFDPGARYPAPILFVWSDLDGDHEVGVDEVQFDPDTRVNAVTVGPGLEVIETMGLSLRPTGFTPAGAPLYDLSQARPLIENPAETVPKAGGIRQVIRAHDDWLVQTGGPLRGYREGRLRWTYPNPFPDLHASHYAPTPRWPGDLMGGTRLLGPAVFPREGEARSLWLLNGNFGSIHALTGDGLYVATLTRDSRTAKTWPKEVARGDRVSQYTNGQESFWPSVTQTDDGGIYVVLGGDRGSITRLAGLETIRRLPDAPLTLTPGQLTAAAAAYARRQAASEQAGPDTLTVRVHPRRREPAARYSDWTGAEWVELGGGVRAAVAVAGDRLHVIYETAAGEGVNNTLEDPTLLFKTGAAFDLMLATNPAAEAARANPVAGDQRLVVALGNNRRTAATLYRQVDPAAAGEPVTFSSGWRSVDFATVRDVTGEVTIVHQPSVKRDDDTHRLVEIAVPLSLFGLRPGEGLAVRADLGFLRGSDGQTVQRLYWRNKAAGLTSDVPGEAMLTPGGWGTFRFATAGPVRD